MEEKKFSKTYNAFEESKKKSVSTAKIYAISSVVIVIAVLVWTFSIYTSSIGLVNIVDVNGQPLQYETVRQEKLTKTLITSHCERTAYFCNSFDRFTLKENQANTYFLMEKRSADNVFAIFKNNGIYGDVLTRGWSYESKFDKIVSISGSEPPYKVQFTSFIFGKQGDRTEKYLVKSEGILDIHTPQYPENPFGYFFTKYDQIVKRIKDGQD